MIRLIVLVITMFFLCQNGLLPSPWYTVLDSWEFSEKNNFLSVNSKFDNDPKNNEADFEEIQNTLIDKNLAVQEAARRLISKNFVTIQVKIHETG